jgi:hypothetical protein
MITLKHAAGGRPVRDGRPVPASGASPEPFWLHAFGGLVGANGSLGFKITKVRVQPNHI